MRKQVRSSKLWVGGVGLLLAFLLAAPLRAGTVSGVVVDTESSEPIESAAVNLCVWNQEGQYWDWAYEVQTDEAGRFAFRNLEPGKYVLRAGKLDAWSTDFEQMSPNYLPKWFENIPGGDHNISKAKVFEMTGTGSATARIALSPTPASVAVRTENGQLPDTGGTAMFHVKMKNWTQSPLKLKVWGTRSWVNERGAMAEFSLPPNDFTLGPDETKILDYSVSVPAKIFGSGGILFQIGPSLGAPWNLYGESSADFSKLPPHPVP